MKPNNNELQNFEKVPNNWTVFPLGKVLPISYGKGLTKAKRDESGKFPVYGSSGQVGVHSESLTKKPSLILGRKGSVGEVHYSKLPCWPIDTVYFAEEHEGLELKFFHFLLKGLNLAKLDKSTAVPGLSRDDYNAVEVAVAPLDQQQSIVAEIEKQFSRLDEAVTNLKRIKANLKRYKAAVLKAAVEGKLTENWREAHPNVEPASKLLARILTERRTNWKGKGKYKEPSLPPGDNVPEQPAVPETWSFVGMDQLLPPTREAMKTGPFGSLLKKHEHRSEGIPVLGIENIETMRFVRGCKIYITKTKAEDLVGYRVIPHDVLISRSGTVGEVCVVPNDIGEARISTNLMKLSLIPGGMLPEFFVLLFNGSPFVLDQVSNLCKGSTRNFLNQEILKPLFFVLPPLVEQQQILSEVERRLSFIEELEATVEANLTRANRLRQAILQSAFTGQLVPQGLNESAQFCSGSSSKESTPVIQAWKSTKMTQHF